MWSEMPSLIYRGTLGTHLFTPTTEKLLWLVQSLSPTSIYRVPSHRLPIELFIKKNTEYDLRTRRFDFNCLPHFDQLHTTCPTMRRIPRLRRPSGLPSPSTTTTTNISRSVAGPSHIAQPFSSSSQSTISALPSRQRPTAARSFVSPPSLARFSSSEKQPEQKTPTPTREPEVEAQTQAQTQEQEPGTGPGTELQHASRVADDIIDHRTGDSFSWSEETAAISAGPYTAPPSQRVEAARQHEVADPTYSPATTSEGLKTVGGLSGWWSNPDHWGAGGDFTSFRPREKVTDPALIEAAVRRAVVEAFALREVGHEDQLLSVWPTTVSKADLQGLLAWDLKSTGDGSPTLGGSAAVVAEGLRWKDDSDIVSGDHDAQHEEILSSAEAAALSQTWDQSWKTISLVDPRIRFAVRFHLLFPPPHSSFPPFSTPY